MKPAIMGFLFGSAATLAGLFLIACLTNDEPDSLEEKKKYYEDKMNAAAAMEDYDTAIFYREKLKTVA